ncbi:hypothetical protein [Lentzea californiensis]|uniref:hypothetical protein n=1 Tax=Lentzea californiensis TaxID=438851 RepID=UPI0021643E4F|nr:hypothetical protein [Lentzea californiensis]
MSTALAQHPGMADGTLLARALRRLATFATRLVNEPRRAESGWYVETGEGDAIAGGNEYLSNVDVDDVLGQRFRLAVQAVVEINGKPDLRQEDRFDELRRAYFKKLGASTRSTNTV